MFFSLLLAYNLYSQESDVKLRLQSSSWFEMGRVVHSTDTLNTQYNYNDNWIQSVGAQFTILADLGDNMQAAMGLGGFQSQTGHHGTVIQSTKGSPKFKAYVTQARFSYFYPNREENKLRFNIGLFPYNYNPDIKNLGNYLFRGPVYPGLLISGFDSETLDPSIANFVGMHLQHNWGVFSHDFILRNETTNFNSNFDFSLGYVGKLNFGGILKLGAGANFYRVLPINKDFTTLSDTVVFKPIRYSDTKSANEYNYVYIKEDTLLGTFDTTRMSHQGIKVMGNFVFDPKPLLGGDLFGPEDLKFYVEAAIIGTKDYKGIYDDISERMPMVFGFNIPTFGFLDVMSIEIERYKSPYRNDITKLKRDNSPIPPSNVEYDRRRASTVLTDPNYNRLQGADTTLLFSDNDVENMHGDDIKWSLYLSKTLKNYVVIKSQVASDHLRLTENNDTKFRTETAFTEWKDWYFMMQIGYQF